MTKLSYTLRMKVFACFIAVLSGITAFFDGLGIFQQQPCRAEASPSLS